MSRLRVLDPANPETELSMAEAIRAQAEKIVAAEPAAVFFAWEAKDGTLQWASVPPSGMLERGMVDAMHEEFHPVMVLDE